MSFDIFFIFRNVERTICFKKLDDEFVFEERAGFFFLFKCEFLLVKIFGIFISITVYVIFFLKNGKRGFSNECFLTRVFSNGYFDEKSAVQNFGGGCVKFEVSIKLFVFRNE